ncbi:MAG: hypothetical protein QM754_17445 [Tepidisphaeraceae bacterium]
MYNHAVFFLRIEGAEDEISSLEQILNAALTGNTILSRDIVRGIPEVEAMVAAEAAEFAEFNCIDSATIDRERIHLEQCKEQSPWPTTDLLPSLANNAWVGKNTFHLSGESPYGLPCLLISGLMALFPNLEFDILARDERGYRERLVAQNGRYRELEVRQYDDLGGLIWARLYGEPVAQEDIDAENDHIEHEQLWKCEERLIRAYELNDFVDI